MFTVDMDEQYAIQQEVDAYLAALKAEEDRKIAEYLAAVEAQRQQEERARQASATSHQGSYNAPAPTGSGDCAGVAAVVGWGTVQHESGGNPMAENGIYKGCAQIGLPWWNGACSGLSWTNPADQATCAQIVMNSQGPSAWAGTYSP